MDILTSEFEKYTPTATPPMAYCNYSRPCPTQENKMTLEAIRLKNSKVKALAEVSCNIESFRLGKLQKF